jgi:hypothetical protein
MQVGNDSFDQKSFERKVTFVVTLASANDADPGILEYGPQRFTRWNFFGSEDRAARSGPNSGMLEAEPDFVGPPHYHLKDEYQIFLNSVGTFTNRPVRPPATVQYNDAWSVYGPFTATDGRLRWLTLRELADPDGAQWISDPVARENRKGHDGRQFMVHIDAAPSVYGAPDLLHDRGDGACVYRLALEPGQSASGPDLKNSRAHWYVVIGGSIVFADGIHPAPTQLRVDGDEAAPEIQAGAEGADVVIVGFRHQPDA